MTDLATIQELSAAGRHQECLQACQNALQGNPEEAYAYKYAGKSLLALGQLEKAQQCLDKAHQLDSSDPETIKDIGNIFNTLQNDAEAIRLYKAALSIDPNYTPAINNLGLIAKRQGNLTAAEQLVKKARDLDQSFALYHMNLGGIYKDLGNLDQALDATLKSLELNPDNATALTNLGGIYIELGNLDQALTSTLKSLELKPDLAGAAWNLYGLANSIEEAEQRINQCLEIDENYLQARLTLGALKFHQGDKSLLKDLLRSKHKDHSYTRSFGWMLNLPEIPKLFFHRWALFDSMIDESKKARPFYEFGVWRGISFKYLINTFKKGYGFDTFEGLPEDWHDTKKGAYSAEGIIPQIDGGKFIKGKFENTLPGFFSEPRPMASIMNFDADLYSSTLCALNYSKPAMDQHTILIFDEFIINESWEQDEYKALNEFCSKNNLSYQVIAISYFTKQVAVKLAGF